MLEMPMALSAGADVGITGKTIHFSFSFRFLFSASILKGSYL
jgi:hypothetical protein